MFLKFLVPALSMTICGIVSSAHAASKEDMTRVVSIVKNPEICEQVKMREDLPSGQSTICNGSFIQSGKWYGFHLYDGTQEGRESYISFLVQPENDINNSDIVKDIGLDGTVDVAVHCNGRTCPKPDFDVIKNGDDIRSEKGKHWQQVMDDVVAAIFRDKENDDKKMAKP